MFAWLTKLFMGNDPNEEILEPGEEYVRDTPEGRLYASLAENVCPKCGSAGGFYEGPSGGMSTNIECADCGQRYNVTPVLGIAEKI